MAKKMLQKIEVQAINALLQKYKLEKVSARFAYAAVMNRRHMRDEIEAMQEVMKPLSEYEQKRLELCVKYADKDEEGKPVMNEDVFQGLDANQEFQAKMKELQAGFQPIVDDVNKILEEQTEVDFYEVSVADLPEMLQPVEVEILMPMIKDPDEEKKIQI